MASTLHDIFLEHVKQMLGPFGLYQHAKGVLPRLSEGYCVDDNARAVTVLLRLFPYVSTKQQAIASQSIAVCWQFVVDAAYSDAKLYNFRSAEGQWLSHDVSGDMYARVVRACTTVIAVDNDNERIEQARVLLNQILHRAEELFVVVRSYAEVLVALRELSYKEELSARAQEVIDYCTIGLIDAWNLNSSTQWPWFEGGMTYANALLPHGVLAALALRPDEQIKRILQQSSQFLLATTMQKDMFIPIGNSAWYYQNKERSLYDQQPIEASTMLDFLVDLARYNTSAISSEQIIAAYQWFFGKNTAGISLVQEGSGACHDGLLDGSANENCGAESLLASLWAQVRIRESLIV